MGQWNRCDHTLIAALAMTVIFGSGCAGTSGQQRVPTTLAPVATANWRDRDSTVAFEKFILPANPPDAFIVIYGADRGDRGTSVADTISYLVPASGVLRVLRRIPVPWAETHLYQATRSTTIEIPVASECGLLRLVNRRDPQRLLSCWMPLVVSGIRELFANRLRDLPQWIEPPGDGQHNSVQPSHKSVPLNTPFVVHNPSHRTLFARLSNEKYFPSTENQ